MSSKTEKYIKREEEFIFTTTLDDGLVLRTGNGVHFVDLDDREYIDATSQISLLDLGYKPKEVVRFITEQMQSGVHSCISADWAFVNKTSDGIEISRAALAEKLIKISDRVMPYPNKRVIFEVSGATAVNAAARIAAITNLRQKGKWNTQKLGELFLHRNIFIPSHHDPFRFSLLGFKNAFHGRHGEAKLLTDSRAVHYWGPSSSCAVGRLDLPTGDTNMGFYLNDVACLIEERLSNYAPVVAFFFEPIQGEGGINIPDAEGLRQLVDYLRSSWGFILLPMKFNRVWGERVRCLPVNILASSPI
ncbi:MAG: hypothetical protein COV00_02325 [Candidatus Tagabacteria bacterium CG10_big_fil_rev_8_21_14_0_10_40_13]|uniref:Aminotransferase class III n=1 Tax=Candidatus Tagabacteria bacterium CG10_big_fil_rev_8_21_14_0_10_40_13 TaxID=1975022 RepID=A0A2M8L8T9_9BACT|nr:MAG: hypothetical protein COV00_02325 [Candidatus Tagabacteria bacterium CG10_big_fil_rev_8_21_14_0_10_40_13]